MHVTKTSSMSFTKERYGFKVGATTLLSIKQILHLIQNTHMLNEAHMLCCSKSLLSLGRNPPLPLMFKELQFKHAFYHTIMYMPTKTHTASGMAGAFLCFISAIDQMMRGNSQHLV